MLEKIKAASTQIKFCLAMPLIMAVLYLIAIADLDYGYYTFLRIISLIMLGIFVFVYYGATESFLNFPCISAIFIIILFNPITPIYLDSSTWLILDLISAAVMFLITIYIFVKDVSKEDNPSASDSAPIQDEFLKKTEEYRKLSLDNDTPSKPDSAPIEDEFLKKVEEFRKLSLDSVTKAFRNELRAISLVYMLSIDEKDLDKIVLADNPMKEMRRYVDTAPPSVAEFCLNMEKMFNIVIREFSADEETKDDIYNFLLGNIILGVSDDTIRGICKSYSANAPKQMPFLKNKINYQLAVLGFIMQYAINTNNWELQNEVTNYRRRYGYIK